MRSRYRIDSQRIENRMNESKSMHNEWNMDEGKARLIFKKKKKMNYMWLSKIWSRWICFLPKKFIFRYNRKEHPQNLCMIQKLWSYYIFKLTQKTSQMLRLIHFWCSFCILNANRLLNDQYIKNRFDNNSNSTITKFHNRYTVYTCIVNIKHSYVI